MTTPTPLPPRAQREALALTRSEACDAKDGDNPQFKVISDEIIEHSRWSVLHWVVLQRISDGRFFADSYGVGATESQDERPWEYTAPDFREVFPVERTVVEYK